MSWDDWTFLLAKVNFAILGADFLKHFNLIVDLAANQIVDAVSLQRFAARPPAATDAPPASRGLFAAIEATPPAFRGIFSEFLGGGKCSRGSPAGQAQDGAPHPDRRAAGLCIKHWRYGEAASSCEQPCNWQGNGGAGGN